MEDSTRDSNHSSFQDSDLRLGVIFSRCDLSPFVRLDDEPWPPVINRLSFIWVMVVCSVAARGVMQISSLLQPFTPDQSQIDPKKHDIEMPKQTLTMKIASCIIGLVITIAGLYGVYKERHGFLLPYLIVGGIGIIGMLIGSLILLFLTVIGGLVVFAFALPFIYLWLVVYNHYLEIKEGKGGSSAA